LLIEVGLVFGHVFAVFWLQLVIIITHHNVSSLMTVAHFATYYPTHHSLMYAHCARHSVTRSRNSSTGD